MRVQARYSERGPLIRTQARYSECGRPRPRAKQKTHARSFRGGRLRKIGGWAGLQVRVPTRIRIGNEHADRLLTYSHGHNLSAGARLCSGPGKGR